MMENKRRTRGINSKYGHKPYLSLLGIRKRKKEVIDYAKDISKLEEEKIPLDNESSSSYTEKTSNFSSKENKTEEIK